MRKITRWQLNLLSPLITSVAVTCKNFQILYRKGLLTLLWCVTNSQVWVNEKIISFKEEDFTLPPLETGDYPSPLHWPTLSRPPSTLLKIRRKLRNDNLHWRPAEAGISILHREGHLFIIILSVWSCTQ